MRHKSWYDSNFLPKGYKPTHAEKGRIRIREFLGERKEPKIKIPRNVLNKIEKIVKHLSTEVSWVCHAWRDGDDYVIDDFFIPRQRVHGATTEFNAKNVLELMREPGFDRTKWRCWGHSHVNFGTSPSLQDEDQMYAFGNAYCPFFIGGIHNKRGEMFYWVIDRDKGVFMENLPVEIIAPTPAGDKPIDIEAECKDKVSLIRFDVKWPWRRGRYDLDSDADDWDLDSDADDFHDDDPPWYDRGYGGYGGSF